MACGVRVAAREALSPAELAHIEIDCNRPGVHNPNGQQGRKALQTQQVFGNLPAGRGQDSSAAVTPRNTPKAKARACSRDLLWGMLPARAGLLHDV